MSENTASAGLEWVRHKIGAGRNTHKTPDNIHDYDPSTADLKLPCFQAGDDRFEESVAYYQALGYPRPRVL